MFRILTVAFIVVPVLEWYVFGQVSDRIGFGPTLFWIAAVSVIGAALVKFEGMSAWRRASAKAGRGQVPTDELVNGVLILFAGALMLTPGFLTDTVGLLLLFPPTRSMFRGSLKRRFRPGSIVVGGFGAGVPGDPFAASGGTAAGGFSTGGPVSGNARAGTDGVWDVESWEADVDDRPADDRGHGELN